MNEKQDIETFTTSGDAYVLTVTGANEGRERIGFATLEKADGAIAVPVLLDRNEAKRLHRLLGAWIGRSR
jgi:hypothetical protein